MKGAWRERKDRKCSKVTREHKGKPHSWQDLGCETGNKRKETGRSVVLHRREIKHVRKRWGSGQLTRELTLAGSWYQTPRREGAGRPGVR